MNNPSNNRRNKPGPKLSLSGFFSGASGSESAGGRGPPTISPAQLNPTRIIDSNPPSNSEVINAFESVPISAVVDRNGTVSPAEEASSSISEATTSRPALLDPLKHTVVFPLISSTDASANAKQQATQTLLNDLAKDPQATVEIQCVRSADPKSGPDGALDDSEWQELSDLVDAVSGFGGQVAEGAAEKNKVDRRIVISGLLAPPLDPSSPSTKLHTSPAYAHTYLPHLTELSLNANVSLMFLPPVVDAMLLASVEGEQGEEAKLWCRDAEELKRVMRLYVTPAMECFGSHRIIFGSSPTVTSGITSSNNSAPLITPEKWYNLARTVISELVCGSGDAVEAQREMDDVFAGNASRIWEGAVGV